MCDRKETPIQKQIDPHRLPCLVPISMASSSRKKSAVSLAPKTASLGVQKRSAQLHDASSWAPKPQEEEFGVLWDKDNSLKDSDSRFVKIARKNKAHHDKNIAKYHRKLEKQGKTTTLTISDRSRHHQGNDAHFVESLSEFEASWRAVHAMDTPVAGGAYHDQIMGGLRDALRQVKRSPRTKAKSKNKYLLSQLADPVSLKIWEAMDAKERKEMEDFIVFDTFEDDAAIAQAAAEVEDGSDGEVDRPLVLDNASDVEEISQATAEEEERNAHTVIQKEVESKVQALISKSLGEQQRVKWAEAEKRTENTVSEKHWSDHEIEIMREVAVDLATELGESTTDFSWILQRRRIGLYTRIFERLQSRTINSIQRKFKRDFVG